MGPQEGVLQQPTGNLNALLENFMNRSNSILAGTLDTVLKMHPQSHISIPSREVLTICLAAVASRVVKGCLWKMELT